MLGFTQEALAIHSGMSQSEVDRLEKRTGNLVPRLAYTLKASIEKLGVELLEGQAPFEFGVRWKEPGTVDPFDAARIRTARVMLGLSQTDFAQFVGVDRNFVSRLEGERVKSVDPSISRKLMEKLETKGIVFISETGQFGAGVMLKKAP